MNIYFGEVSKAEAEEYEDGVFQADNKKFYDFRIRLPKDYGSDVIIEDGIGRYLPLSAQNAIELFKALAESHKTLCNIAQYESTLEYLAKDRDLYVSKTYRG